MSLRWPVAMLVLLISAGSIKASSALQWIPVDLTALAGLLLVLALLNVIAGARFYGVHLPIGWAVGAYMVATLGLFQTIAITTSYAASKTFALFTLTLGCGFVGGLFLVRTARQRDTLAWATLGMGALTAILAQVAPATDARLDGRLSLSGIATIAPARLLGAGVVALIALALAGRMRLALALPASGTLLAAMVATGSRGPLVALLVATGSLILFLPRGLRLRALLVLSIISVIGVRVVTGAGASAHDRIFLLLSDHRSDTSAVARESLFRLARGAIDKEPFGRGWGGLEVVLGQFAQYPHNILLEVAGEAGILAASCLVVAFAVALVRSVRKVNWGDPSALALFALLVFWIVNALTSGDLNDNRGVFVLLGACLALGRAERSGEQNQYHKLHRQGLQCATANSVGVAGA